MRDLRFRDVPPMPTRSVSDIRSVGVATHGSGAPVALAQCAAASQFAPDPTETSSGTASG